MPAKFFIPSVSPPIPEKKHRICVLNCAGASLYEMRGWVRRGHSLSRGKILHETSSYSAQLYFCLSSLVLTRTFFTIPNPLLERSNFLNICLVGCF